MRRNDLAAYSLGNVLLLACGEPYDEAARRGGDAGAGEVDQQSDAIAVASREDLPPCTAEREGLLAYVREDAGLFACSAGSWDSAPLAVQGDKGPTGPAGPQGPVGEKGPDGTQGPEGTVGGIPECDSGQLLVRASGRWQCMVLSGGALLDPEAATLRELASSFDEWTVRGVARNARTPMDVLTVLAMHSSATVRLFVAGNVNTPSVTLRMLAREEHTDDAMLWRVATNSSCPADLLAELVEVAPEAVASNTGASATILGGLLGSDDVRTLEILASNTGAPPDVLTQLASSARVDIRGAVASNAKTPPDVLASLAEDTDESVRSRVAANAGTPELAVHALATDASSAVSESALSNPSQAEAALRAAAVSSDYRLRRAVATNPRSPSDILTALFADSVLEVRMAVAGNPSLSLALIDAAMQDSNVNIPSSLLQNPSLSEAHLWMLLGRLGRNAVNGMWFHPAASSTMLDVLIRDYGPEPPLGIRGTTPQYSQEALRRFLLAPTASTRLMAAEHASLPAE